MGKARRFISLILLLLTLLTFAPILRHDFVDWDDPDTIRDNPRFRPPTMASLVEHWREPSAGLYVPLTYTMWGLLATVGYRNEAMHPLVFHAASLLLHVASTLIVYGLLRRLLESDWVAAVGALVFALHPVQVEAVAWASGAKDLLGGLLSLLFLWFYLASVHHRSSVCYVLSLAALLAAMLAKPTAVVAPLMAGVIDLVLLRRAWRDVLLALWPMLVLTIPCTFWTRQVQAIWPATISPLWARPLIASDAIAFYLYKLVFPITLTNLYGRTPQAVIGSGAIYWTWIPVAALAAGLILARKRSPALVAGAVIFTVGLLPVLGFTPFMFQLFSTVADHYVYLPMFGVAIAFASLVKQVAGRWPTVAALTVIAAMGVRSVLQTQYWRDSVTLFTHAVDVRPESTQAHGSLAVALAGAGRVEEAVPHFELVAARSPSSRLAQQRLAQAYVFTERFEQALIPAQAALLLALADPHSDPSWEHYLLGKALARSGRLAESLDHLSRAAELRPGDQSIAAERDAIRQRLDSPTTSQ